MVVSVIASFSINTSIDVNGCVRSFETMNSATPSATHATHTVYNTLLESEGLVANAYSFYIRLKLSMGKKSIVQAKTYTLNTSMTYDEISDVYEIDLTDVKKLLTDNADKVNKIKSYYKKMEE